MKHLVLLAAMALMSACASHGVSETQTWVTQNDKTTYTSSTERW